MYLDRSRIQDLKELDQALKKAITPQEREVINKTRNNILRMAQNEKLGKIREMTTQAIIKGDKGAIDALNKESLRITEGKY